MARLFSLDRVQKSPARMDPDKLDWMHFEYFRALPRLEVVQGCRAVLEGKGLAPGTVDDASVDKVLELMQDRIKFHADIAETALYFFTEEYPYDEKAVRKRLLKEGALERLAAVRARYESLEPFTAATAEEALRALAEERGEGAGALVHPVRVAVSGTGAGPGLFGMLELLGKPRVLERMGRTLERFGGTGAGQPRRSG
jgi:glutamyl-tRNA synthetase